VSSEASSGSLDPETNTLALRGEWDFSSKAELRQLTDRLGSGDATIDLTEVTFIDSSVINEIVRTHNRLHAAEARLRLRVGGGHIARLLTITGLDRVIDIDRRSP